MKLFDMSELSGEASKPDTIIKKPLIKRNVGYDELIHINRTFDIPEGYADFTEEKYPYGLVFHDFEVFMYDWLVVLIDPVHKTRTVICNNRAALREYYELHTETLFMMFKYSKANFHDLVDGQILIPKKHLKEQTYQNDEQNKTMKKK